MMLPKWERLKLMQIHKNLGHPSNERLATALRNSGQRPEMVQAAFDLVCPSCLTHTPPKRQRPGSLKPMMDFNHKIYIDGSEFPGATARSRPFFFFLYWMQGQISTQPSVLRRTQPKMSFNCCRNIGYPGPDTRLSLHMTQVQNSSVRNFHSFVNSTASKHMSPVLKPIGRMEK